jgi:hypothetical protein
MDSFISHLKADWVSRPRWMNPIFYFCLYMAFVYMPFDFFFKPLATDHEIWFGVALTGWWAKATEPVHWLIYAAGAYGFWKMKAWMWPWAAVYVAQVVIAMFVWNLINEHGQGIVAGVVTAALYAVPMVALWRAKTLFRTGSCDRAASSNQDPN